MMCYSCDGTIDLTGATSSKSDSWMATSMAISGCCTMPCKLLSITSMLTLQCNPRGLSRGWCCPSESRLLPLPRCEVQGVQIIQAGPSTIPPKEDHLTPHEDRGSPQAGGGGHAVCGGAMPGPCLHIQKVHIIQTLPVCSTTTKHHQPGKRRKKRKVYAFQRS